MWGALLSRGVECVEGGATPSCCRPGEPAAAVGRGDIGGEMGDGSGSATKKKKLVMMELDSSKSSCLFICGCENLSSYTGSVENLLVGNKYWLYTVVHPVYWQCTGAAQTSIVDLVDNKSTKYCCTAVRALMRAALQQQRSA